MDRPNPLVFWGAAVLFFCASAQAFATTQILSIGYSVKDGVGQFVVNADGPLVYTRQDYPQQIVLDLSGATLTKKASRQLDTSSFDGAVTMISPYQLEDEKDKVRIVIQLRDKVNADVLEMPNGLTVAIGGTPGAAGAQTAQADASKAPSDKDNPPNPSTSNSPSDQSSDDIDTIEQHEKTGQYSGHPITLQVRDADVTDVLRLIGDASGFNIIVSSTVTGKITLSLVDVPWDQVLDVVLATMKLGAERSNNILRVMTLAELTQFKQEKLAAKALSQSAAPRVTKVFPINYADLGAITTVLTKFGNSIATQPGPGQAAVQPALVQSDTRTNSLIIQDIPENVERMKRLIEILDTQTPQVMVEAKIIEATETFANSISGSFGVGFGQAGGNTSAFASFNGGSPFTSLISAATGSSGSSSSSNSVTSGTGATNTFGVSPSIGFLPGVQRINALIALGESESMVKLISSPKTVVLHRESASILEGTPGIIQQTVANGLTTTTSNNVVTANISLNVTPTVTNDESVLLQLNISRDVPNNINGQAVVAPRSMTTKVLVDSGSTLVIGGIYTTQTDDTSSGFPFLRKLPIIGALFNSDSADVNRSELFIFVTPRILNTKRSGLRAS